LKKSNTTLEGIMKTKTNVKAGARKGMAASSIATSPIAKGCSPLAIIEPGPEPIPGG